MSTSAFLKGMGAGLLVGSMVFLSCSHKKRGCGRKNRIGRAMRNLGELIEDFSDSLGL